MIIVALEFADDNATKKCPISSHLISSHSHHISLISLTTLTHHSLTPLSRPHKPRSLNIRLRIRCPLGTLQPAIILIRPLLPRRNPRDTHTRPIGALRRDSERRAQVHAVLHPRQRDVSEIIHWVIVAALAHEAQIRVRHRVRLVL